MFCLGEEVSGNEGRYGRFVCINQHFGRACRHVYGYSVFGGHLLGCGHVLVARTKYLIYLRNRFGSKGEGSDRLRTSYLDNLRNTYQLCGVENSRVNVSTLVGRGAEHHFGAASKGSRHTKHQNRAKKGGSTSWDVQAYPLDGNALSAADHSGHHFHHQFRRSLSCMEFFNIGFC